MKLYNSEINKSKMVRKLSDHQIFPCTMLYLPVTLLEAPFPIQEAHLDFLGDKTAKKAFYLSSDNLFHDLYQYLDNVLEETN